MAEVFSGTPILVSVRIDGPDGRMTQYHVAGQDVTTVAEAVKKALAGIPAVDEQEAEAAPKKARKPRRTKKEMAAAQEPATAEKAWPA